MLALGASSVAAQGKDAEFKQLAEQCSQIRNTATDGFQGRALARPLADELEALAQSANQELALVTLLSVINEEAAACVAHAHMGSDGDSFTTFDPNASGGGTPLVTTPLPSSALLLFTPLALLV